MMKRYRTKAFVLSLGYLLLAVRASAQVQTTTLEYWTDNRFAERISMPFSGQTVQDIDVSKLCPGIHTLEMRVGDSRGRWGAPLVRHFLKSDTRLEGNGLGAYKYCIDGDWDKSVRGELSGIQTIGIDISALSPGIHTLQMHITDKQGRQSQTLLRHFLALGEDATKRTLTTYRYWVDDFGKRQEGTTSDGQVALDIDVSQLAKGIHTLCYQVADNTGRWSAPRLRHFLIPDLQEGCDQLVAYEYWFNHGPRRRVEFSPTARFSEKELLIEVKDVEPQRIPDDYEFNAADETVTLNDDVFFGMQIFNGAGMGSLAMMSDTVKIDMTILPQILDLQDGDSIGFKAPHGCEMTGWKTVGQASDSLTYRLTAANIKADFYNGNGQKQRATMTKDQYGNATYGVKTDDGVCYLLLYEASQAVENMGISLTVTADTGNGIARLDNALQVISAQKKQLIVRAAKAGHVRIVSIAGAVIYDEIIPSGTSTLKVPSGICLVRFMNGSTVKVLVP